MTTNHDLQAICDDCGQPIPDGGGHVWVDHLEAADLAKKERTKVARTVSLSAVLSSTRVTPWRTHHHGCTTNSASTYGIPVEELRTFADVLNWTAHLLEKPWLSGTNWYSMLRVCTGKSDSRTGLVPAWHRR